MEKNKSGNRTLKLIIAVAVLIILLILYFALSAYSDYAEKEKAESEKEQILFSFNGEDADSFSYVYGGTDYSFDRNQDGSWVYRDDSSLNLDQNAVDSILYNFTNVAAEQIVAENTDNAADYGLSTPAASFTVFLKDGSSKKLNLGNKNSMMDVYYAYEDGKGRIFTVAPSVFEMLAPVDKLVLKEDSE